MIFWVAGRGRRRGGPGGWSRALAGGGPEEGPGGGGPSYASYASLVKTKYENAWQEPNDAANDNAIAKVSVTIGCDGTVYSSHITRPSGDPQVDRGVILSARGDVGIEIVPVGHDDQDNPDMGYA